MTGFLPHGSPDRRIDLDWLRIGAFLLLMLYHVGLLYVPWPYHAKSTWQLAGLVPAMLAVNPWRLSLLFLIAGVATRHMAARLTPGRLAARRSARLLPPLLFGILVVVPPQSWVQAVEQGGYGGGLLDFWRGPEFGFAAQFCRPGPCIVLPTWNHLWFVVYLWTYTMLLAALLAVLPGLPARAERVLAPGLSGPGVVALPALALAAMTLWLRPRFPPTDALVDDWYNHAQYGTVFLFGVLLGRAGPVWAAMQRWRWAALLLAAVAWAAIVAMPDLRAAGAPVGVLQPVAGVAFALQQWGGVAAALGFGRRWLRRDGPARRYLTDAVFPWYIAHQTVLVLTAHALTPLRLPAWQEAGLVLAATFAGCALTYEAVRRVPVLRPLFGLGWQERPIPAS